MADGAVLPGGVHRLQDDEYGMGALRRQPRLVIGEQRDPGLEDLLGPRPILAVVTSRRGGIEVVREPDFPAGGHQERLGKFPDPLWAEVGLRFDFYRHLRPPGPAWVAR